MIEYPAITTNTLIYKKRRYGTQVTGWPYEPHLFLSKYIGRHDECMTFTEPKEKLAQPVMGGQVIDYDLPFRVIQWPCPDLTGKYPQNCSMYPLNRVMERVE